MVVFRINVTLLSLTFHFRKRLTLCFSQVEALYLLLQKTHINVDRTTTNKLLWSRNNECLSPNLCIDILTRVPVVDMLILFHDGS